jgi:hypothetical protein
MRKMKKTRGHRSMEIMYYQYLYFMRTILPFLLVCAATIANGQDVNYTYTDSMKRHDSVLTSRIAHQPEFPGGETAMMKYVWDKVRSLELGNIAEEDVTRTKIVLRFIVNEDGTISDIVVKRSINPKIDRQIVDIFRSFPIFKSACDLKNKPLKSAFLIPLQLEFSNK